MKLDFDKAIDQLLREHARRGASLASGRNAPAQTTSKSEAAHLDVDELSAFAENALPQAARARYIAHLADCDACRRIAAAIASAADVAGALEKADAREQRSPLGRWAELLGSIFTLASLRYALPVLALVFIGVVTLVAVRMKRADMLVAQRSEEVAPRSEPVARLREDGEMERRAGESAQTTSQTKESSPSAPSSIPSGSSDPSYKADQPAPALAPNAKMSSSTATDDATVASQKQLDDEAQNAFQQSQSELDQEQNLGQKSKKADEVSKTAKPAEYGADAGRGTVDLRQQEEKKNIEMLAGRSAPGVSASGVSAERSGTSREEAKAPAAPPPPPQTARRRMAEKRADEPKREREADEAAANKDKEARDGLAMSRPSPEMRRSIAGRQFRREGSAWVDVAYRSSQSTINVARGSEQYRALIADEPGMRSIVEQLSGEVIVVWKGRAYRIR